VNRRHASPAALSAALVVALVACGGGPDHDAEVAEVAERGAEVMPFDLEATTHHFAPLPAGLEQTVVVDDPADTGQLALVRDHLRHEADRFAAGDFGDPAAIHGDEMPGLAELEAGHADVDVRYAEIPEGGRIDYTTDDPDLVAALHAWGEAQASDHGAHAEHGDPDAGS
jgi:hypothetical protein